MPLGYPLAPRSGALYKKLTEFAELTDVYYPAPLILLVMD